MAEAVPILPYEPAARRPRITPEAARLLVGVGIGMLGAWTLLLILASAVCEPTAVILVGVVGFPFGLIAAACVIVGRVVLKLRRLVPLLLALSLCAGATIVFNWPMRLVLASHHAALDRLASSAVGGTIPPTPVRVGVFVVRRIEVRNGAACLWLDPNPAGPSGFVRCPPGTTPPCNIWSETRLSSTWFYVEED